MFSSVQSLSRVQLFATPWTAACQACLSITNSWSLFKLMSIKSVMPSNHLILCHPLSSLPQSLPASESFPMNQLFARVLIKMNKYRKTLFLGFKQQYSISLTSPETTYMLFYSISSKRSNTKFKNTLMLFLLDLGQHVPSANSVHSEWLPLENLRGWKEKPQTNRIN